MVSDKGKRKLIYADCTYYWFVRVTETSHRIYIISEDRKVKIVCPFRDTEEPVTPSQIVEIIKRYKAEN